jgi:hypothetical protein
VKSRNKFGVRLRKLVISQDPGIIAGGGEKGRRGACSDLNGKYVLGMKV